MSQGTTQTVLLNAVTTNGNSVNLDTYGMDRVSLELRETAGGTASVTPQGSFDGTNWYTLGYQRVDAQAAPARAAAAFSVTANLNAVLQILDAGVYPQMRVNVASIAAATLTVKAYAVPS